MDRARTVFTLAVLAAGPAFAAPPTLAALPRANASTAEYTTIVFGNNGLAPVLCTSRPDIGSVAIQRGEPVILANVTGVEAAVDFGGGQVVTVANGHGVSVRFALGRHTVSMIPNCLTTGEILAAVVNVREPGTAPPSLSAPPMGSVPAPSGPAGAASTSPAVAPRSGSPGSGDSPAAGGSAALADSPILADSAAPMGEGRQVDDPMLESGFPIEEVFPLNQPPDKRDERLLGIIAAICVFGVTTAIIRAIVAQRATRVVST